MKKSTFFLIAFLAGLLASLVSCTKQQDFAQTTESKIEFSLYNNVKTYTHVNAGMTRITGENIYSFVGDKEPAGDNFFSLTFMTDSLRAGTYDVGTGVVTFREGTHVVTNMTSSGFTVTINSNVNGLINGTFQGTLYDHQTNSNCTVLQGKIENIQLIYRQ